MLEKTRVFLHFGYVNSEIMKNTHAQWALIKSLNGHGYFLHLASLASGQESPREPKRAQESPGEPRRAQDSPAQKQP